MDIYAQRCKHRYYEGSSGGMEPEAALERISDIQNTTKNAVYISILCADDDTTLRSRIKKKQDGGDLDNHLISPQAVSDPGHRIKNTVGVVWKLALLPLSQSLVKKPMARTFEFGMIAAIRSNCGSTIDTLQEGAKAPLLHMFDVHSNCKESFCSVKRKRKELLRLFLIYKSVCSFQKPFTTQKQCYYIDNDITESERIIMCRLLLDLADYKSVNEIRDRLKEIDTQVLLSELMNALCYQGLQEYHWITFTQKKNLDIIIHKSFKSLSQKDRLKMQVTSAFRLQGDPKTFQTVPKKKTAIQTEIDACSTEINLQPRKTDLTGTFYYPDYQNVPFEYKFDPPNSIDFPTHLYHFLSFKKAIFQSEILKKLTHKVLEKLRKDNDKQLWELQINKIGQSKERHDDVERGKNCSKMLDEFKKRQELKEDEKWFFDIKDHVGSFFQMQFKISPYLNKSSLIEINHCLSTQLNECLNRSVSAIAPKDRSFNGSQSLAGRIAAVVSKTNLGDSSFLKRISSLTGLSPSSATDAFGERADRKATKRRAAQGDAYIKLRRSVDKKRKRTDEIKQAIRSQERRRTYVGHGGGKDPQQSIKCRHPGCFGMNHKTERAKACKYHGLTAKERQDQIDIFLHSASEKITP
jgi:hypothetical protein